MADVPLNSLVGGGSYWADFSIIPLLTIASGVTGDLLTVTCEDDERVVLTVLSPASASQAGISVSFGGSTLISESLLSATASSGAFKIGAGAADARSTYVELIGKAGQSLVVSKNAGNTAIAINYAYKIQQVAYV